MNKEEKRLAYVRGYYDRNRERILKEAKEKREKENEEKLNNPEYIAYKQNKEYIKKMKLKLYCAKQVLCEVCGFHIRRDSKRRHKKTQNHQHNLFMQQHNQNQEV
jgi:6-phosphogluconate dehydrogenase